MQAGESFWRGSFGLCGDIEIHAPGIVSPIDILERSFSRMAGGRAARLASELRVLQSWPTIPHDGAVDTRLAQHKEWPASVHRLDPTHHARQIFRDRQIAAGQLLQSAQPVLSVVDRGEMVATQELGQLPSIDPIALAAVL